MGNISRVTAKLFFILLLSFAAGAHADWQYDYYEGNWSALPDFASLTPVQSGTVAVVSTAPRLRNDQFALRFRNQISVPVAGNYQFSTRSDDGSQLLIDGAVVVDNNGLHGPATVTATIFLSVGSHDIEVTHFEQGGGELIEASYATPGGALQPIPADGNLDGPAQLSAEGLWGPVLSWPHIPVSAANLPDGRVLTWASNERYAFPGGRPEFTFTAVWNPADGSITEIDHPGHDMFCAHQVMLEDGKIFVSGGRNQGNSPWTSVFDIDTNQWVPLNNMNRGRWYPTSLALADGTVFTAIGSGGGNTSEVYHPDTGAWELLSGINFNNVILNYPSSQYGEREWWPLFHLAPDGTVFHSGPTPQMHTIDTSGAGSATPVGAEFSDWYPKHGTTVMYDEGKLLTAGGWQSGTTLASTNSAMKIDLNGPAPAIAPAQPMRNARKFHNGVMLPTGEVLVVGGNTSGQKFNDSGSVYAAEIWNPSIDQWREVAAMSVPRNYHSIALLLTDGTVLSAGGGLCNCSADHPDGQIYSPPYLFNADGSPALRPAVLSAPPVIRAGDAFDVATDSDIAQFSLIKMSSTTHAVNTDLRYLNVPFSGSSGAYQLDAHANPNVLTPGYWMLFALNAAGTPSVAQVLQVQSIDGGEPAPVPGLDASYSSFVEVSPFRLNGTAASVGGTLRLTAATADAAGSAFFRTPISISTTTSFSTSFEFSMNGQANGAEGMAFVLQGNGSAALGAGGSDLGYGGIANSLVVEIDTADSGAADPDGNHIAVHLNGDTATPLGSYSAPFDLEDGSSHKLWIDYSALDGELSIYLDENAAATRPALPIITVGAINLVSTVGTRGYFGFSAATGVQVNNHDLESWAIAVTAGDLPLTINELDMPPQPSDGPVNFSASAEGQGLEYSWTFGDGSAPTPFTASPDISHSYAAPGRYLVTLIVRDMNGITQTWQFVQAVYPPLTPNAPTASSTLIVESQTGVERVWNVNPDNDSVTVINGETGNKVAEIPVGEDPRALAAAPNGTVWITNKDDASISIIDISTLAVVGSRALPRGSRPHGIVMDSIQGVAYVALEALQSVWQLDVYSNAVLQTAGVGSTPRHLSLTGDGARLYVSRFITPPLPGENTTSPQTQSGGIDAGGEIVAVDTGDLSSQTIVTLGHSFQQAAELKGPGFPNYLGPAIIAPSGLNAWIPSKQDNILRGSSRNGSPLNHEHTVRAVTSVIDLATASEVLGDRVDHDNASIARNGAFDPYGVYLFVALEGNREVAVVDAFSHEEILRFDVALAPQSVAVSPGGARAYVHNFMSRSISIVNIQSLINGKSESVTLQTTVSTTAGERLNSQVLRGKQLFYDARDPRMARDSYMACAACHNDGGHDGRVWDISSMGEGLRNTISLKGHAGMGHGPLHWSANFDEIQDFENQIRTLSGGTGLMSNANFAATQNVLGAPKAGLSTDLDALAAYVSSLNRTETSPYRNPDGSLTADGQAGKALFGSSGCAGCHSGNRYTDSAQGVTHDIGTLTAASGNRLGGPLTALDSPTLKGLWSTAPYLHDGSAATLRDAVLSHDAASLGGVTFADAELDSLVSYLQQVDDDENTFVPQPWLDQDIGAVAAAGSFADAAGVLSVTGSGADIWYDADEFHFVYQSMDGDGDITARVASLDNTHVWAKAGVMIRESLDESSAHALMLISAGKGAAFQYRGSTGGSSAPNYSGDGVTTAPYWVRIVRSGDLLQGYMSSNGVSWTLRDSVTIAMSNTVYIGLAVTSHNDGALATATFDNVSLDPAVPPVPDTVPPTVPQNVSATAAGTTGIDVSWNASSDADSGVAGYRVFRDGVQLTSVTGTGYADTGLSPSTAYTYTVLAFDNASPANLSAQSAPASATTHDEVFVLVPSVEGQPQASAESSITAAGLAVGTVTTTSSNVVAANAVISQNPAGGSSVLEGSAVDLVVSLGPAPVAVPDVVGLGESTAITSLNNAGLTAGTIQHQINNAVPAGNVISQDPAAGTSVAAGSAVNLVISDGPPPPDETPPTVPQNLTATTAGAHRIDLAWNASTDDDSGVGGYQVFQDGVAAGSVSTTGYAATGLASNTAYTFTVLAFDNASPANQSAQSAPASATTDIAPTWLNQDIGAVAAAGSFADDAGVLGVTGSGADIWYGADEFHFVYQSMDGDGEITARVASLDNTHAWAKAGVMIRESLDESSAHALMLISAGKGAAFQYRTATGGSSAPNYSGDGVTAAPYWVRIVRSGDLLQGYMSSNGVSWTLRDSVTIAMSNAVYIGLAVTSHNDGTLATATFDNVMTTKSGPPVVDNTPPTVPQNLSSTPLQSSTFSGPVAYAAEVNPHSVTAHDLDGDARLDLVVSNAESSSITVLRGNGDGTFTSVDSYATGARTKEAAVGDVDNDGIVDIVTANVQADSVSLFAGIGDGSFQAATNFGTCSKPHSIELGHANGDANLDVLTACQDNGNVGLLLGNGDGTFQNVSNLTAGSSPFSAIFADLNGDTVNDIAVANYLSASVSLLFGNGDGTYQAAVNLPSGIGPHSIRAGDLNADSYLDLAVANDGSNQVTVYINDGSGSFPVITGFDVGDTPKSVRIADLNGDAIPDLLATDIASNYPSCCSPGGDQATILTGLGDGTFGGRTDLFVGRAPFASTIGDFNGDGKADFATANWHDNEVAVLLNSAAVTFKLRLDWSPSVDNETGISGYRVHRDGANIATTVNTTYVDSGLIADTTYSYTISALDNATPANESPQSAPHVFTTPL